MYVMEAALGQAVEELRHAEKKGDTALRRERAVRRPHHAPRENAKVGAQQAFQHKPGKKTQEWHEQVTHRLFPTSTKKDGLNPQNKTKPTKTKHKNTKQQLQGPAPAADVQGG